MFVSYIFVHFWSKNWKYLAILDDFLVIQIPEQWFPIFSTSKDHNRSCFTHAISEWRSQFQITVGSGRTIMLSITWKQGVTVVNTHFPSSLSQSTMTKRQNNRFLESESWGPCQNDRAQKGLVVWESWTISALS